MTGSVLIIGSTGRMGQAVLKAIGKHNVDKMDLELHAFTRSKAKFPNDTLSLCTSVIEGDALHKSDICRALIQSKANYVVVSVGAGDDTSKTSIRTDTAKVLADTIAEDNQFDSVKVIVISSMGAGESKIKPKVPPGLGMLVTYMLRYVIKDHNGQEAAFVKLEQNLTSEGPKSSTIIENKKVLIVRPASLTEGKATGKFVTFDGRKKTPNMYVDRADVALFVVERILQDMVKMGGSYSCSYVPLGGKIHITGV